MGRNIGWIGLAVALVWGVAAHAEMQSLTDGQLQGVQGMAGTLPTNPDAELSGLEPAGSPADVFSVHLDGNSGDRTLRASGGIVTDVHTEFNGSDTLFIIGVMGVSVVHHQNNTRAVAAWD